MQIIAIVAQQLKAHPGYSVVTTGHSLGGSLSSLAAVTIKHNFPDKYVTPFPTFIQWVYAVALSEVRSYSYGAPRTGVSLQDHDSIYIQMSEVPL